MTYLATFTMVSGGITMTFNVRPSEAQYDRQAMIHSEPIAGGTESVVQNLGHGGFKITFNFYIYNLTTVTMTGATTPTDIIRRLMDWWTDGDIITFISDFINEESTSITCKLLEFEFTEVSGHQRSYKVNLTLQEYVSGSAI